MISPETRARNRRYFYAEHWKIGTISRELGVHPDAVRNAIESERFKSTQPLRASVVDPYIGFVRQILEQHPRLICRRQALIDQSFLELLEVGRKLGRIFLMPASANPEP
jgi:DNA-binding transcriptional MerR regulator